MAIMDGMGTLIETRLHPLNLALAGGVLTGLTLFFLTIISLSTGYAMSFLEVIMSVYPGYRVTFPGAVIALVYGFIDAFVGFFVLAWLYNYFEARRERRSMKGKVYLAK